MICAIIFIGIFFYKVPLLTQDGPNHKKVVTLYQQLPTSPLAQKVYQRNSCWLTTNSLFTCLAVPALKVLSIDAYEKWFYGFFAVLLLISYRLFLQCWYPANRDLWVIALPFVFDLFFIKGMYNFLASIPFTFLALAFFKQGVETKNLRWVIAFLLSSWAAFLAHPFPFFIINLSIAIMTWHYWRTRLKIILPFALIAVGFFMAFIFTYLLTAADSHIDYTALPVFLLLTKLFGANFPRFGFLPFSLHLPYLGLLLGMMLYSLWRVPVSFKIYWLSALLLYFLFPDRGNSGSHINQRFVPYIFLFLPLGLVVSTRFKKWVGAASIFTFLILGADIWQGIQADQKIVQEAKQVYTHLPKQSLLYPLNFEINGSARNFPHLLHLWAVYPDDRMVLAPNLFAYDHLMSIFRIHPSTPTYFPAPTEIEPQHLAENNACQPTDRVGTIDCNKLREIGWAKLLANGYYYDYWFINAPPPDFLAKLNQVPHLMKVAEAGRVSLWHYAMAKPFDPPLGVLFDKRLHGLKKLNRQRNHNSIGSRWP